MCAVLFTVIVPSRFAEEDHDHLASHVVRSQQSGNHANDIENRALGKGEQQDFVLAPESGKWRNTSNGQPADDESKCGDGHEHSKSAHLAHVLFVVHSVNHRTRPQEQQGLEECVGHHVEDRSNICT